MLTDHPVLRMPTVAEIEAWRRDHGDEWVKRVLLEREERIRLEKVDPYRHGFLCPSWARADAQLEIVKDLLALGGNRAAKSEWAGLKVDRVLVEKPGARAWCFQSSAANSREMQQPIVHKYLPREWKDLKKGKVENVSYSQKGGFTEETFVLPNGSQCWFRNYEQDITKIEGGELDIIWCDELVPQSWLETLRYRLVTRGGILLVTFTPIEGYNATVKEYLSGARTLEWGEAELLPRADGKGFEKVPLVQECATRAARIVYFPTKENPYAGYENLKKTLAKATRQEILCRAYGVPTRAMAQRFPKFGDWNVVPAAAIPADGSRYQVADPADGRNYFMIWAIVDRLGQVWIYREWPSFYYVPGWGIPGAWAVPSGKADGDRGPAQTPQGWGLRRYKEEIERLEGKPIPFDGAQGNPFLPIPSRTDLEKPGWRQRRLARMAFAAAAPGAGGIESPGGEIIQERFMDLRAAHVKSAREEEVVTLLEEWEQIGVFFTGVTGHSAEGREAIDNGVHLINDLLDWNRERPMETGNRPRLFVSEECKNVIYAMKEWTGLDGRKGACKDPVDTVRYLVEAGAGYVGEGAMQGTGGGYW